MGSTIQRQTLNVTFMQTCSFLSDFSRSNALSSGALKSMSSGETFFVDHGEEYGFR